MLCRDKVATQELLAQSGISMPELCTTPHRFKECIQRWGQAFAKPRYGALGQNVSFVTSSNVIPRQLEGVVPGYLEPTILQRAIAPPNGWAGMSARHLVQRSDSSSWISRPIVLRRSKTDPVVNVARGAEAVLANHFLPTSTIKIIEQCSLFAAKTIQSQKNNDLCVEFGMDYVIDSNYHPWLIEVNSRPRGRLEVLAHHDPAQFQTQHQQACIQPILYLASVCQSMQP